MPNLPGFYDEIQEFVMAEIAAEALEEALEDWPVRTGASKAGFTIEPTEEGFEMVNDQEYAPFVEARGGYIEKWFEGRNFDG